MELQYFGLKRDTDMNSSEIVSINKKKGKNGFSCILGQCMILRHHPLRFNYPSKPFSNTQLIGWFLNHDYHSLLKKMICNKQYITRLKIQLPLSFSKLVYVHDHFLFFSFLKPTFSWRHISSLYSQEPQWLYLSYQMLNCFKSNHVL